MEQHATIYSKTTPLEGKAYLTITVNEIDMTYANEDDCFAHTVSFECASRVRDADGNARFDVQKFWLNRAETKELIKTLQEALDSMPSEENEF